MRYRKLGNSGLELSEIGLGTWAIGGGDWGRGWGNQSKRDSIDAIIEALEHGVNWIDTAHAYGFGLAEEVVAEALASWKEKVVVATKCGVLPNDDRTPRRFISPETIQQEVELSLSRLKVESIDLYQIHWPSPKENLFDSWEKLKDLQTQGKVIKIGVCNCNAEELKLLGDSEFISSNQPMYNILERKIEKNVVPWCSDNQVGILAYSPMHSGLLTGKVSKEWFYNLPDNDWRKHKVDHPVVCGLHTDLGLSNFIEFQADLKEIARQGERSVAGLAVAWVLRKEEISSAIVGARKKGQIKQIVNSIERALSQEEVDASEIAFQKYQNKI